MLQCVDFQICDTGYFYLPNDLIIQIAEYNTEIGVDKKAKKEYSELNFPERFVPHYLSKFLLK